MWDETYIIKYMLLGFVLEFGEGGECYKNTFRDIGFCPSG
jgi:hypothetical protein